MEWAPDWEHRVDFMLRNGLLVRVEGMAVDDLVAVYLSAYDAMLPLKGTEVLQHLLRSAQSART